MDKPKPLMREVTGPPAPAHLAGYLSPSHFPDHILRSEGGGEMGLFRLYAEMEEKDAHLFSVLQTRKSGVLARPRKLQARSDSPEDQQVCHFVETALEAIPDFDRCLLHILDALGKGLSVQEILWKADRREITVAAIRSRNPENFLPREDGSLLRNPWSQWAPEESDTPRELPPRKFLTLRFGDLYENGYGRGLCARAYWYYWFKKNNLKFWVVFNEKFGAPTVVGKYRPGATEEDRDRLFDIIESLQNDTGVTVPDSVTLELLEAQRSGNAGTYHDLANWCNGEMSKLVLGATLTSDEGERSGSYALAQVHDQVRGEYIEADARMLENVINGQLIRWLVDFNFGVETPAPRWTIDTSRDDNLNRDLELDRQLVTMGIPLPLRYFYEKYKRPAPLPEEPALCFDDQNLFQYHLHYGIVTVNEARKRLGLAPVPWGEERVAPQEKGEGELGDSLFPLKDEKGGDQAEKEREKENIQ